MSIVLNQIENKVRDDELINQVLFESLGDDPQTIIKSIVAKTEKERWENKIIDDSDYFANISCAILLFVPATLLLSFASLFGYILLFIVFYLLYEGITAMYAISHIPNKKISLTTLHLVNIRKRLNAPYLSEKVTSEQLLLCADYFEKEPREIHKKIHEKCSANLWRLNSQFNKLSSAKESLSKESEKNALGTLSQNRIKLINTQLSELNDSIKAIESQERESDRALKLVTDATDNIRQLVDALNVTQYLEESPSIINDANRSLDETSILLDKILVASAKSVSSLEKISDAIEELKKNRFTTKYLL